MKVNEIPFYVVTCDKTSWILKSFAYLANKFWKRDYKVLGFKECPELPDNFQFISMAEKQEFIQLWTKYIYEALKNETSEYVFFSLDDYLFIDYFKEDVFNTVIKKTDKDFDRYELGWGASYKKQGVCYARCDGFDYDLFVYGFNQPYIISCQISLWRTKVLLKVLNHNWTPWEFEVKGSKEYNNIDVVATKREYALRWIEESALSNRHPGMVNVLGLKHQYVFELLKEGFIKPEQIQFGMGKGEVSKEFNITLPGKKYQEFYDNL